jgi:hypothetical protein
MVHTTPSIYIAITVLVDIEVPGFEGFGQELQTECGGQAVIRITRCISAEPGPDLRGLQVPVKEGNISYIRFQLQ